MKSQGINSIKLGDEVEHNFILDEKVYKLFLELSKDQNPIHVDQLYAKKYNLKSKVMHGNILNAFISFMVGELLPIKNVMIIKQDIKFKTPVYLNDKLLLKSKVVLVHVGLNAFEMKFNFKNNIFKKVASGKIMIKIL